MELTKYLHMEATNLGTAYFSIKKHLDYHKKQKLAYAEKMQYYGR